jgi:hypothetical protein
MLTTKTRELSESEIRQLEKIMDSTSVSEVLGALVYLGHLKAEHILSHWQDEATARTWARVANKIDRCSASVRKEGL